MSRTRSLNAVLAAAPKKHSLPIDARKVLAHYFALVDEADLARDPAALAAAALDHLSWAGTRRAGTAKVRAFNPTADKHGYRSEHTIVQTVNDDMPFLVDSTTMTLDMLGHGLHLTIHPRFAVERDRRGRLLEVSAPNADTRPRESFIHFEIARQTDPEVLRRIERELERALRDVRAAVEDWQAMLERLQAASEALGHSTAPPRELAAEGQAFLDWLADDHFTLLGYAEYRLRRGRTADTLERIDGTALGIQKLDEHAPEASRLTGAARDAARSAMPLVITKANARSRVHRPVQIDYVSVKTFDRRGQPATERRFLGLFTSAAYSERPRDVPLLRLKVAKLAEQASAEPGSHRGRRLQHVIDTLPRDDLMQGSIEELSTIVNGVLGLQERRRVRLLWRRDPFGRFYSCLIYLPRDQYTSRTRVRIEGILLRGLGGTGARGEARLTESALARLAVTVQTEAGEAAEPDFAALELEIAETVRGFQDRLREALLAQYPEDEALALLNRFADRYSAAYQDEVPPAEAAEDITRLARLADGERPRELVLRAGDSPTRIRFTVFSRSRPIPLHVALPILENMGAKVRGEGIYTVRLDDDRIFIQAFTCDTVTPVNADDVAARFAECFARVSDGSIDNDAFNGFVLRAGLDWRDAAVLRAYGKYLAQTNLSYSQAYVHEVLARSPAFVRALAVRFHTLFDPDIEDDIRKRQLRNAERTLAAELAKTETLDVDRILRAFADAVEATLRTNCFQRGEDSEPRPYLAFKLDPAKLPELPKPLPMFEVFVYSQRVEGVHLRASKVARGGIRWSDRREDFRTEVLGLMKAQQVKNAVIVPNGAKGGFVCKRLPEGDRAAIRAEVVECYRTFIRGLLDVTDNLVDDRVVHPARTLRRDGDDSYLVVAADKGTATFSDIANALAVERNFWLGDAFASGGSAGYDHKEMGITARGGWESVKRHFRELKVDIQRQPFTVVGIGDMSGDVFGNGMLLSEQIRLIAAFDHRHVFIDPDPDAATGFAERKRLFELPTSSWADYDTAKLSKGGGVYSRQSKAIELSPEAARVLGLEKTKLTPPEVIRAVLQAPVDLLWNGGIGTYVKASSEPHTAAGDPTNDALRVNGADLRCRVVGEGGNLGFTQRGRIEYALRGGRLNADFIDNSGGVDSSDREVNIKILLNGAVAAKALRRGDRNRLLASMEEDIIHGVLANNYAQSQAISAIGAHAAERLNDDQRLIRALEAEGRLDREIEFLPSDEEIEVRRTAGLGLTRPELAIVLAYAKIELTEELVASDIPEDRYCAAEVEQYFPPRLRRRFQARIAQHPLRREIIAMLMAGSIVNRMGPFFVLRAREEIGASVAQIARAYSIVREVFDARRLWRGIEALDLAVPASVQYEALAQIARVLQRSVYWFLQRHLHALDIESMSARFKQGVHQISDALPRADTALARRFADEAARLEADGLPRATARHIASLGFGTQALELVQHATERRADPVELGRLHLELSAKLGFDGLRTRLEALTPTSRWQSIARAQLHERLASAQRNVLADVLDAGGRVDRWLASTGADGERVQAVLRDLEAADTVDFAALTVTLREIERLAKGYNSPS